MAGNSETIWSTLEAHCWAGGFQYEEYVEFHKAQFPSLAPLCEEAFKLTIEMFDAQLADDEARVEAKREAQDLEGL